MEKLLKKGKKVFMQGIRTGLTGWLKLGCNTKKYKITNVNKSQKNHWTQVICLHNTQDHGLTLKNTGELCNGDRSGRNTVTSS